jgi:hypothetical protein
MKGEIVMDRVYRNLPDLCEEDGNMAKAQKYRMMAGTLKKEER